MDNATLRRRGSQSFDDLLLSTQAFLINEPRAAAPSISSLSSAQREYDGSFNSDGMDDEPDWNDDNIDFLLPPSPSKAVERARELPKAGKHQEKSVGVPARRVTPEKRRAPSRGDDEQREGRSSWHASPVAELERKLQELRTDPSKRQALEQRIAAYKSAKLLSMASFRNFGHENRDVTKYQPENKQSTMKDAFIRQEEHAAQVMAAKEKLQEDLMQHKLSIIHRKEIQAEEDQRLAEEEWQRTQRELAQKRWMVLVAFGSRQAVWQQKLQQARIDRLVLAKRVRSAIIIQRAYRAHYTRTQATRLQRRIAIVYRALRVFIFRFRVRRKIKAADTLRQFLSDIQDTTRIVKVIKRFRFCVSQAQQQWREYADVERAQLHVLLQQWNRVEREMEGSYHVRAEREKAKQAIMSKSLFYEGPSSRARRGTGPPRPRSSMGPSSPPNNASRWGSGSGGIESEAFPKVPAHIKTQLLLETLRLKKYIYGKQLVEYYNQMVAVDAIHKQQENMAKVRQMLSVGAPAEMPPPTPEQNSVLTKPKPKFSLILPKEDVINLINRGITLVLRKPQNSTLVVGANIMEQVASVDIDIDDE